MCIQQGKLPEAKAFRVILRRSVRHGTRTIPAVRFNNQALLRERTPAR